MLFIHLNISIIIEILVAEADRERQHRGVGFDSHVSGSLKWRELALKQRLTPSMTADDYAIAAQTHHRRPGGLIYLNIINL